MKYIKKFENHAAYEAAESRLILPNVSLCAQENEVYYKPFDPYNGHEYVDLGLPSGTKWATMNVGASSETDYGLYFQWGDAQGYTADQVGFGDDKKYFGWKDYKYGNGTSSPGATGMTKYNNTDHLVTLEASDDAVAVAWGGSWRMPTEAEFTELLDNTNKQWTTVDGVKGYKFTHKNDASKYVFLPAAGECDSGSVNYENIDSNYWSSSLNTSSVYYGRYLKFNNGECNMNNASRSYGFSVRGVVR
jgi:uncharacterized protein (TIGR02145 family)